MKIIRRMLLVILTVAVIILTCFYLQLINRDKIIMNPENLTVVVAPEQSQAMEHPDFMVEEYVSMLPEGTNVALGGRAEVSSYNDVYTGIKAIDGKSAGTSYWEGAADSYPNILTVNLKDPYDITAIRVCINPDVVWGARTQVFSLWTSTDGVTFTELISEASYEFNPTTGNEVILEFESINSQYFQLQFTQNTGSKGAQVAEFEIYSK